MIPCVLHDLKTVSLTHKLCSMPDSEQHNHRKGLTYRLHYPYVVLDATTFEFGCGMCLPRLMYSVQAVQPCALVVIEHWDPRTQPSYEALTLTQPTQTSE